MERSTASNSDYRSEITPPSALTTMPHDYRRRGRNEPTRFRASYRGRSVGRSVGRSAAATAKCTLSRDVRIKVIKISENVTSSTNGYL